MSSVRRVALAVEITTGAQREHRYAHLARQAEEGRLKVPDGCYVNFDLRIIDFLKSLDSGGPEKDYEALRDGLERRPTLVEFHRSGASVMALRRQHGSWFQLVDSMGDLTEEERLAQRVTGDLLRELEVTAMTKSFKMILLEAWLELAETATGPDGVLLSTGDGGCALRLDAKGRLVEVISSGKVKITAKEGLSVDAGGGLLELTGRQVTLRSQGDVAIEGSGTVGLSGAAVKVAGSGSAEVTAGGSVTVRGGIVRIN